MKQLFCLTKLSSVLVWNLVCYTMTAIQTEDVREQVAEENIWT
jgi:hypothetical protein